MFSKWVTTPLAKPIQVATQVAAALATLRVGIGLVKYAFNLMLRPMQLFVRYLLQSADAARRMYAKSLTSGGLPLGFTIHRSLLADALGVGENEVIQYGRAIEHVNNKFKDSAAILTRTTPILATLGWEWKALQASIKAMGAMIAAEFAPVMKMLLVDIREIVTGLGMLVAAMANYIKTQFMLIRVVNIAALALSGQFLQAMGEVGKLIDAFSEAPTPTASSNRMPASAWEKMGLVIGQGPGTNYSRETAKNTARTADAVIALAKMFGMQPALPRSGGLSNQP